MVNNITKIELEELSGLLQGQWQMQGEQHQIDIKGTEITVMKGKQSRTSGFEIVRNAQLKNWQIKLKAELPWGGRTYIVAIDESCFMLYDFEPKAAMQIGLGSKLLHPARTFKYHRVPVAAS